jgi:hypothetical protein
VALIYANIHAMNPSVNQRPSRPGQNIAFGFFACAAVILLAVFSYGWLTSSRGDGGIGPLGAKECRRDECRSSSWSDLDHGGGEGGGIPGDIVAVAYLILVSGIATAALLGISGGVILQGKLSSTPYKATRIVAAVMTAASAYWMIRFFSNEKFRKGIDPGWAFFLAVAALVTALILIQNVSKLVKTSSLTATFAMVQPAVPPQGQPPAHYLASNPPAPHTYPCLQCHVNLVFVAQYQRWYCENCKEYT